MAQRKSTKPTLVKVGRHYINPKDVSSLRAVKVDENRGTSKQLYVIEFISNPNPEYTCWVHEKDIDILLQQFDVKVNDA